MLDKILQELYLEVVYIPREEMKVTECLICLRRDEQVEVDKLDNKNGRDVPRNHENTSNLEMKLQSLSHYLAFDLEKRKEFLSNASICEQCDDLLKTFSELYSSLQIARLKVNTCLRRIRNVMKVNAREEDVGNGVGNENSMECERTTVGAYDDDSWKQEILQKCDTKLAKSEPKVAMDKLKFFKAHDTFACVTKLRISTTVPPTPDESAAITSIHLPATARVKPGNTYQFSTKTNLGITPCVGVPAVQSDIDNDPGMDISQDWEDADIENSKYGTETPIPMEQSDMEEYDQHNFVPIGTRELQNGNGTENYFHCLLCENSNITDTSKHMRENHRPRPLKGDNDRERPGGCGDKNMKSPVQEYYGKKKRPLPKYIAKKELTMQYDRMRWIYECQICNVEFSAIYLARHILKHANKSGESMEDGPEPGIRTRTRANTNSTPSGMSVSKASELKAKRMLE